MTNLPLAELLIALREQARRESEAHKMLADAKTARQTDRDDYPELADIGYDWIKPEQTVSWKAADTIERLEARVGEAEDERDEAVNWSAIVDRHGTDGFDALGDRWLAMEGVQRMHKAVSSVFAKYASDEIMTRFREHMTTIMHQSFVEGCLVGVRAEMAKAANFLATKGAGDE